MPPTFDIGLVMARAVLAGAYTGGSLDFLHQALDVWYDAKGQPDMPPHDVLIRLATGASAGGMPTSMYATTLREPVPPITANTTETDRRNNKFYDVWVSQISIERLLVGKDLAEKDAPGRTLVDSTVLDTITAGMFTPNAQGILPPRPYVANPLVVALTLTNVRGLSEDFYRQNVQLGRLNAQSFLKRHFVLRETDPTYADWSTAARDHYRIRRDNLHRFVEQNTGQVVVFDEPTTLCCH